MTTIRGNKMKTKPYYWPIVLLTITLFIAGCGGPKLKVEPIPVPENPTEEEAKLENSITRARQQQVNILSPTWFSKAETSLREATELISGKGEIGQISNHLAEGYAELEKAEEMAALARTAIPEAIKSRELARTAGATAFETDYAALESDFLRLTRAIEDNNVSSAQRNEQEVADGFRAIEIRAIKENTLGDVRKTLTRAEAEKAGKLAPKLLAESRQELLRVENYIAANPYATKEMQEMASDALFNAKRLLQLTQQMSPSNISLWTEDLIAATARNLGAPDMRDQPFGTQKSNILGAATALTIDRNFLSDQNSNQAQEIALLKIRLTEQAERLEQTAAAKSTEQEQLAAEKKAAEERLAAEQKFNALYSQVQAMFSSAEAESYKQGQQMVIRLRGMNFPVGQSVIMPENYPLLSKVQNAIRTFEGAEVTIEGHTDSSGSEELNLHLSQKRAEAVQDYLLANRVIASDKITAAGYGPSRPLAPNSTAEGRAQNRRIDVIITP
jgi:OOP family OmpA-OmpF porin